MAVRKLTLVLDMNTGSFSTRIVDATGKLRTFDTQVNRTSNNMRAASTQATGLGRAMRDVHHSLSFVHVVLAALASSVGGFTLGLVKMNSEAQRSIVLLEGMSTKGTVSMRKLDAAANFQFLKDFAKTAPFSMKALTDTFVKMKSVGIDPTKGAMKALIDGIAQFGGGDNELHRASVAIQQMMGKGVISMEELRQQLGEAMPTALKMMAQAAEMSIGDFVKQVSLGKIKADEFLSTTGKFWGVMQEMARGSAERMMATFAGQVSQTKTLIAAMAMAIGGLNVDGTLASGGFMDILVGNARSLNEWLASPAALDGAKQFGRNLAEVLRGAAALVGFLKANATVITVFATGFLGFQAVILAQTAVRSFLKTIGFVVSANGTLASSTTIARMKQLEYNLAVAQGKIVIDGSARDIMLKAKASLAAANTEVAAIGRVQAALVAQKAQYEANIAAARASQLAARASFVPGTTNRVAEGAIRTSSAGLILTDQALAKSKLDLAAASEKAARSTAVLTWAQKANSVGAKAAGLATKGFGLVMAMLGGPIIGGVIIAIGALVFAIKFYNENLTEAGKNQKALAKAQKDFLPIIDTYRDAMIKAAGATGDLRNASIAAAEAQIFLANRAISTARTVLATAQSNARAAKLNAESVNSLSTPESAQASGVALLWANYKADKAARELKAAEDQAIEGGMARRLLGGPGGTVGPVLNPTSFVQMRDPQKELDDQAAADKAILEAELAAARASSGSASGGGKAAKVTTTQRLEGEMADMVASQKGLQSLMDTLDLTSDSAEEARGKIAKLKELGKEVPAEMAAAYAELVQATDRNQVAYKALSDVISGTKEQAAAFEDTLVDVGSGTDKVDASSKKFARSLAKMREEILAGDPAFASNIANVRKLDSMIAQSTADQKFIQIAGSVAALTEELDKAALHNIDPNLDGWGAWAEQVADLDRELKNLAETRASIMAMEDGPEKVKRLEAIDKLEAEATNNKARSHKKYLDEVAFSLEEEIRVNEEALMTTDQVRQAAFEREMARIDALTQARIDAGDLSVAEEERLIELRDRAREAATGRFERDMESPMKKMVRDYEDVNARLKDLQGEWMSDFMDKMRSGELSFGDMVIQMLEDYVWMLAQAKMAAAVETAIDGIIGFVGSIFGSMGIPGLPTTGQGAPGVAPNPLASVTVAHTGGLISAASARRSVDPDMFARAPRFHGGRIPGLKRGELPAILKDDEGVFTQEQMAALGRGVQADAGGAASALPPVINVNIINESGQELGGEQEGGGRFDGPAYIIDVVVNAMGKNGKMRSAMKSVK